jgi:glycosyltransferase involved in cell wall biosynthesis
MILVLGMHRSGTSAVAGTLAQLGVDFSEHLIAPAADNPKGFFEHADIWQQDHEILEAMGSAWDDPLPLPPAWQDADSVRAATQPIQAIMQRDFATSGLAGIKDPRMCRLLPCWRDWLLGAGFAPMAVLVTRRPVEVIASLAKRDSLPADQAAWVWLRHVLEAEADTRGMPRVVVSYESLLGDWRAEAARIARVLGVVWPRDPVAVGAQVDAFLEPTLRHHRDVANTNPLRQPLHGWVERTYAAVTGVAGVDGAVLDQVSAEIAQVDVAGAASAAVLRAARQRRTQLAGTLQWCDDERQKLDAGNTALRENLQRHVEELAKTKRGSEELQANLERHVQELAQTKLGVVGLQEDIERRVARLAELSTELAEVAAQRAQLDAELAAVYASRSWRITRPMRGVLRLARRVARGSQPPHLAAVPALAAPSMPPTVPGAQPVAVDPAVILAAAFASARGPRVLIVTPDILGPIRNGGIGTAFGALAQTLAQTGHAVTILYTLGGHCEDGGSIERWQQHYAALGIRFVPIWLEHGEPPVLDAPHHAWRAYRVYLWLKQHQGDYELAYFPEWKGESYYALQAKRLGLDFARLRIIVVTHSSTTWAESGNYVVPQQFDDLLLEFLERRSIEMADAVISPSQYMIHWMRHRGWRWSAPTHVIQNLMPDAPLDPVPVAPAAFAVTEWVFFGRLERRKGLLVFLDALARMPAQVRERIQVTFLGKSVRTPYYDSDAVIAGKLGVWTLPPKIISDHDRDQALAYLQHPGRVAIIASLVENSPYTVLECVLKRIPFVAADVGGIAELVHPEDRARALFKPTPAGLAATLLALDGDHYASPRPAVPAAATRQGWLALQEQLLQEIPESPAEPAAPPPHITVCLVHYDRPAMLAQAIDSLRQQTYAHFDVVLVDDGSPSAPARQYLDGLQAEFAWRGWSIVRQANAYLGAARNNAVRHARGDYVLFMDDDNIAKPQELAVFAHAARTTNADILTTVSDVFSDADGTPQPGQASQHLWVPLGNAAGLGVFRNVFGDANALVRRRTFETLGGFTEDYGVGHEDWEFFARASLAGANLQLVPEPLFWYRVNAASMLRGGDAHIDLARSVRPYWEGFPAGIGPVLAYATHMHHWPASDATAPTTAPLPSRRRRLLVVATGLFRADTRARFRAVLKGSGWRATVSRMARYIGLTGPRH